MVLNWPSNARVNSACCLLGPANKLYATSVASSKSNELEHWKYSIKPQGPCAGHSVSKVSFMYTLYPVFPSLAHPWYGALERAAILDVHF